MNIIIEAHWDGLVTMILLIMFGPAVLCILIGLLLLKKHKKAAKVFFILGVVYVTISLGICGGMF